jgi:glutaredoxin
VIVGLILGVLWPTSGRQAVAQTEVPGPGYALVIHFFWGDGCPHCARAKPALETLVAKHPEIILEQHEVYYDAANQTLFAEMAQRYGIERLVVPTFFVGPYWLQGYGEQTDAEIEALIRHCLTTGCVDARDPAPDPLTRVSEWEPKPVLSQTSQLDVFGLGIVDLGLQPLLVSTGLIALVDGFNPCSLWALSLLLALTVNTGSRWRVLAIGLTFILVTGGVYALFIAGLFGAQSVLGAFSWVQTLTALVAIGIALINIKDYFWFKQGPSLTVGKGGRSRYVAGLRALLQRERTSWWGMIAATTLLAAGVSLTEFSCTAGFPVLWTNLLTHQGASLSTFLGLLFVYMLIYQLDEFVVFGVAVASLRAARLKERHGRLLKLVGGTLLFSLGLVMLTAPAFLNSLAGALVVFGLAGAAAFVVHNLYQPRTMRHKQG